MLAARDERGRAVEPTQDLLAGRAQVRLAPDAHARGLLGLGLVGRHHRRAAIALEMAHLGVDQQGDVLARGQGTQRLHQARGDHALLVVGDNDGAAGGKRFAYPLQERVLDLPRQVVGPLAVRAHHLLVVGDDARLDGGGPARLRQRQRVLDAGLHERVADLVARDVAADHARQHCLSAQRVHVVGHVAGATQVEALMGDLDHRDRRLGRDARDAAPEELVQHHVTHDQDAAAAEAPDQAPRARHSEAFHAGTPAGACGSASGCGAVSARSARSA